MISSKKSKTLPDFSEEKKLWKKSFRVVIGVDEVGRGSWVGPLVVAACAFSQSGKIQIEKLGIDDSKALKTRHREKLSELIKKHCLGWSIGEVGVGTINRIGVGKATNVAMRKAVGSLFKKLNHGRTSPQKTFVLIDAFYIRYLRGLGLKNQKAIIHGDEKSISIAAASILAKVYRDKLLRGLAKKHPQYRWGRNKGYGTKEHQGAILKYGITKLHRKKFVETFLKKVDF
ncbi:ribonuclease HII [Candidatus Microgenomates bacterium]|nr:ribonuclease HII [Candidatus Microgenomates bacterium]